MTRLYFVLSCLLFSSTAAAKGDGLKGKSYVLVASQGSPVPDGALRIHFYEGSEGRGLSFGAGCNSNFGSYELADDHLVVPGLGATEMSCRGPEGGYEHWMHDFVIARPRIRYDAKKLTLERDGVKLEFLVRQLAAPDRPIAGTVWSVQRLIKTARSGGFILEPAPTVVFARDGSVRVTTGCNQGSGRYTRDGKKLTLEGMSFGTKQCKGTIGFADRHLQTLFASPTLTFRIDEAWLSLMGPGRVSAEASAR